MIAVIDLGRFLWMALGSYKRARRTGRPQYSAWIYNGVPEMCIYVAVGREAWRVSQTALENLK